MEIKIAEKIEDEPLSIKRQRIVVLKENAKLQDMILEELKLRINMLKKR